MTLVVKARQTLGEFVLDAGFTSDGGVTALFGPSGSGKTSLVRVIAGLSKPDHGRLVVDGETLLDTESRIFVPKHKRRFGYVFQESRLFPHLSVHQNLAYGRWFAPETTRTENFDRIVDLLGIGLLLDRRPGKLSGGEKQRVAIGRALLSAPRLLLMDEPLAALDDQRKAEILPYLERLRDETSTPIVYVSHSVSEVARLADKVVIMKDGRVEAIGTPSEVLSMPSADRRDAGAVLTGTIETIDIPHRLATIRLSQARIVVPNAHAEEGLRVRVHIPERDVMIATRRPEGLSALNILDGTIAAIEPAGDGMVRIRIRCGEDILLSRITALSVERLELKLEKPVFAVIKTVALER
ncbi:molybdenum ABC transporter ATP-binding protein [Neorhizobium galegae]|uniref:molybdenum ABC transporter ATP-binding protein n=1 Tax=Neorhizobium galegae TaxID=399 RepID=UPI002107F944|nr:molybdenum ABC transporter ATP-binding protein [Neorhizobium galegae]MCQ1776006.1 molybdenum ABC transporter ATP-binding protein [Neorhizobium galegae]MCQ1800235.1 molybdenum ABC transporter ATP-binding protein [Neorhizobium galegae]